EQVLYYNKALFSFEFKEYYVDQHFWVILIVAILFSFTTLFSKGLRVEEFVFYRESYSNKQAVSMGTLIILLLFLSTASIVSSGFNPFIYFRF
ncbi:MAG: MBOAT family protein, partial [Bacteroidales bacterium]|nr:MBOAT family protein [Bacteroidales bacterium]